jgi:hypothetical protein
MVLVEGGYKQGGEEDEPPSLCELIEANVNIMSEGRRASE